MKTLHALYKGNRVLELRENIDLPKDTEALVIIPQKDSEEMMRSQFQYATEKVFAKLWENEDDEVWSEYL